MGVGKTSCTSFLGVTIASVPGLPCYVRVLICGGGDNAIFLVLLCSFDMVPSLHLSAYVTVYGREKLFDGFFNAFYTPIANLKCTFQSYYGYFCDRTPEQKRQFLRVYTIESTRARGVTCRNGSHARMARLRTEARAAPLPGARRH